MRSEEVMAKIIGIPFKVLYGERKVKESHWLKRKTSLVKIFSLDISALEERQAQDNNE